MYHILFRNLKKEILLKSIKIALAAVASIFIAGELGLRYSATAGIITILSIQNTKRETLQSAGNRAMAFLCALLLAALAYRCFGFTLPAFAIYLFLFALLCFIAGWVEAIAMDSVLIAHFLAEKNMGLPLLLNEIGLFLIGTAVGILVNMHLRRKEEEFAELAGEVDEQIKGILHRMSLWLVKEDKSAYGKDCFVRLEESIDKAKRCAVANYNNALFGADSRELAYILMRERQSVVLQGIYENIISITYLPKQAFQVSGLLERIRCGYHKDNTVEALLEDIAGLFTELKEEALPASREEFEARAILFYILKQLEKMLLLKAEFAQRI